MPIYEFECTSCDIRFDRLQKLSDPDPTDCPECAQPKVRRRLTAPAFRLAGSGWYETDFKGDKDKKRNLAEKGEKSEQPAVESNSGVKTEAPSESRSTSPTSAEPTKGTTSPASEV